jgi:hypothetical protein
LKKWCGKNFVIWVRESTFIWKVGEKITLGEETASQVTRSRAIEIDTLTDFCEILGYRWTREI